MSLRPHQIPVANRLLEILATYNYAADLSDCGCGKTYVACHVIAAMQRATLVVGPKIAETTWHSVAAQFGTELDYCGYEKLRTGNTPFGTWENLRPASEYLHCLNCQQVVKEQKCYCNPQGLHCVEVKKKPRVYGKFTFHPGIKFLVFDESHRASAMDSLNAEMMLAAKRQGIRTLVLSATAATSPLKMRALGYLLDLHNDKTDLLVVDSNGTYRKPNFFRWSAKYGCRKDPAFKGWKWFAGEERQKEVMAEIRGAIIPKRGVRVSTRDIPGFPACQIEAELYDIDAADKINRLYEQMNDALEELQRVKEGDKCPDHPLTKILRARQQIELLKVPIFQELATDYEEKGFSVAMFVSFKQTIHELIKRLPIYPCVIDGDVTGADRDIALASFQSNLNHFLLLNSEAGKESLSAHDLYGRPRVGLVMPVQSAVTFRQLVGRLPRDGGLSPALYRVVFAAGTVEVAMQRALRAKLNNLDSLNDQDLSACNLILK